jgi:hypothetical protein
MPNKYRVLQSSLRTATRCNCSLREVYALKLSLFSRIVWMVLTYAAAISRPSLDLAHLPSPEVRAFDTIYRCCTEAAQRDGELATK